MLREAIIKLAGATLLLAGIGFFAFGFALSNKFMQATGFMSGVVSMVLLYYLWAISSSKPIEEEPPEIRPVAK